MYSKDEHIQQLELTISALTDKIVSIRRIRARRNDEQSLKWRNSSFYWKKKCRFLEEFIVVSGMKVPVYEN